MSDYQSPHTAMSESSDEVENVDVSGLSENAPTDFISLEDVDALLTTFDEITEDLDAGLNELIH